MSVHPIEAESYRILAERVDLSAFPPGPRAVVARVVHATAEVEYASTMVVEEEAVAAGIAAIRAGAPVVSDVEMVRAGLSVPSLCFLEQATSGAGGTPTRSAAAMRLAAQRIPKGAIVVIGCAPTALAEVIRLAGDGHFAPSLVIGLPVGFVGAASAKAAARIAPVPTITNVGEKGGSAAAAAALNAIVRLAAEASGD